MNPVLEDIYRTGKCLDLAGKERKVTGAVPREDALILQEMVRFVKAKTTLETGVAFGLSTLAICEALTALGTVPDAKTGDSGAVEKPHLGAKSKPDAETVVRNSRSSVTCTGVILSATLTERGEALFQQPHSPSERPTRGTVPVFAQKHYGVDPEQNTIHGGAALAGLKRAGLDSVFELLEGPSHLMLPRLLEKGVTLDLGFIDGWHTFDYTMLDFFYIDKMLRPGGVVLLHDRSWPSKQKVIGFIRTHRRYRELPARTGDTGTRRHGDAGKRRRRAVSATWHWLRGAPFGIVTSAIANRPEIAAFLKLESFEPDHRFFHNF